MGVDGLSPNEYWRTAQEDIQIAKTLQRAVTHGVTRADEEAREERERAAKAAERTQVAQDRLQKLTERV